MQINADWSESARVDADALDWVASPLPGVDRRMLERDGEEVARATSIVRYAPGSAFSAHDHALGEEYIVLDGVFSDEQGDFGVGSYVRNPPGSRHTPSSAAGCTIFVKLRYMDPADGEQIQRVMRADGPGPVRRQVLLDRPDELVEFWSLDPGAEAEFDAASGEELFVIAGSVTDEQGRHDRHVWLRRPPGGVALCRKAGPDGAQLWRKTRYLAARML